jgi:RNA polymerase sigma factor (sigma-70 family)
VRYRYWGFSCKSPNRSFIRSIIVRILSLNPGGNKDSRQNANPEQKAEHTGRRADMIRVEEVSMLLGRPTPVADQLTAEADHALIERFADSRDGAAFAAVVARHGRMVYGVCRRAVRDAHLAEDAFQAVFLVLAANPGRAARASAVGGWLFGVARRVGLAARRRELRQSRRSKTARPRATEQPDFDDLLRVLDEELAALPDEFRAPLVACFLEERTLDEAARHLGWSVSTLRRRLERAKDLLRTRLTRRGATLAAGLFAGFLAQSASAAVPGRVLEAEPTALARALAAEIGRGPVMLKASLAMVVVALGLGGMAAGLGGEGGGSGVDHRAPAPPADRAVIAPAPREVDVSWTAIRGRIVFPEKRPLPAVRVVPAGTIKDFGFFGQQIYRDVMIDPETRGIANAVVWLRPDSEEANSVLPADSIHADLARAQPREHGIFASAEGFTPRITAARAGDRLVFSNPTPVPFTVHYQRPAQPGLTSEFNVLLPPGRTHTTKPLPALGLCDTVTDNIHHWVEARVWAFEHPYFAVSDAGGNFTIPQAPVGSWRLVVWHEKAGFGAGGRLGARIEVSRDGVLKPLSFESAHWGE